ncbi:MAG TPA: hypothetical protein VFE89_13550 [Beijerinckiaceae bacterium]|jgi:hypothetical protein|nr:hypothetical protein [Beijerinckiaceae bacterium]
MRKLLVLSGLCLSIALVAGSGAALAEKDEMGFIRVLPGLYGDPTKPGIT